MFAARVRADAAQQRRFGLPDALDRLSGPVGLNIFLDPIGGAAERKLAQRHEVALAKEVAGGAFDLLGNVDFAGLQASEQLIGRNVDENYVVRRIEERVGNRFPYADARNAADDVIQALEMLDVERSKDVDACCEQLFDVLPALRVSRARCVRMRELIDEQQCRVSRKSCIEVEFLDRRPADVEHQRRQLLQSFEQGGGFDTAMRFEHAHDHIGARATHRLRRKQHRVGLADTRRRAEEDLQFAPCRAVLLRLEFREELIGVGPLSFHRRPSAVRPG